MRQKLFIRIAERVTFSRVIAADRRAYKQHPTHQPTSHERALQGIVRELGALDRHPAKRRAEGVWSLTKRLWGRVTGV